MRVAALTLVLAAAPVAAQVNTTCQQMGTMTNCQTASPQAVPQANYPTNPPSFMPNRGMVNVAAAQGTAIDHAYLQVGDLIAAGQCERAKQLATFYGIKRLIVSTAKACP
jgi:hypothetical protein